MPKTNEENISVTYGCIRFCDRYRFLSMSLDGLVKKLNEVDSKIFKKEFPDKWQYLNKNWLILMITSIVSVIIKN